jgi:hypothetical protein
MKKLELDRRASPRVDLIVARTIYLVVPTNGDIIDKEWWEFLKRIDPDYVISTTQISDALKDKINAEIHPIDIETPRPNQQLDLSSEYSHIASSCSASFLSCGFTKNANLIGRLSIKTEYMWARLTSQPPVTAPS